MTKWLIILILLIVAAVVWQSQLSTSQDSKFKFTNPLTGTVTGDPVPAPGFESGGQWINSEPLVLSDLVGPTATRDDVKAVLVDFWTYSCINCQRTIPYLISWWEKYQGLGLVIVGVHSPEFEFEKDLDNVIAATQKYAVTWPVVQDNNMTIWSAYKNRYWPRKYLINKEGVIVYDHIGEGAYEETERRIQEALGLSDMDVTKEPTTGGIGFGMMQTPELYITTRGQVSGHLGQGQDQVELIGDWQVGDDYSLAGPGASLSLRFKAGQVNLVMSVAEEEYKSVTFNVDDQTQTIEVLADDLYDLWSGDFGNHTLTMNFTSGVRVHAFTFGQ